MRLLQNLLTIFTMILFSSLVMAQDPNYLEFKTIDEENNIESSPLQKFYFSHQEISSGEETRGFHLSVNSLSLHEKTSFNLSVFQNRQELVERFGSGRCFRIFHSFNKKDQEFGHL